LHRLVWRNNNNNNDVSWDNLYGAVIMFKVSRRVHPGSRDECSTVPGGRQPFGQAADQVEP